MNYEEKVEHYRNKFKDYIINPEYAIVLTKTDNDDPEKIDSYDIIHSVKKELLTSYGAVIRVSKDCIWNDVNMVQFRTQMTFDFDKSDSNIMLVHVDDILLGGK